MKKALITGITGQDGMYLAHFLLEKGYEVHGIYRRCSTSNTSRIDTLIQHYATHFFLHVGDVTDATNMVRLMACIRPDEIYNLAAQSDVAVSFATPEYTMHANALSVVHILEAIRILDMAATVRIYQASSSELFGKVHETPQRETTPFYPRSPYAVAKLAAFWLIVNYRESYGMFASNGILFNHESPVRGIGFVTRKVVQAVVACANGSPQSLLLGNLNAQRDWGYAFDYVRAMWLMLQHTHADDFVIATGQTHSVREFTQLAFAHVGIMLQWQGSGLQEVGIDCATGRILVAVDERFFRACEVDLLCGDASKAARELGWKPHVQFHELIKIMVDAERAASASYLQQPPLFFRKSVEVLHDET